MLISPLRSSDIWSMPLLLRSQNSAEILRSSCECLLAEYLSRGATC